MAKYSPIRHRDNWFQGERKRFEWPIVDDEGSPLDLTGRELQWRLFPHSGSSKVLIELGPDDFEEPEGEEHNVAVWVLEDTTYTVGEETLHLPAAWYHFELWDKANNVLLSYAGAKLRRANSR